jgi:TonB-dependent starch-binding outer membrane protein SusC
MTTPIHSARAFRALAAASSLSILAACSSSKPPQTASSPSGSTSTVTSAQLEQTGETIEQQIMKRSPGVWVGRTAEGAIAVRIRGGSSLMGNNEPLYILDGSPFTPGPNGALTGLNPQDIDTIKVLKEPADLTMYGARGANGVIVIKTKNRRT